MDRSGTYVGEGWVGGWQRLLRQADSRCCPVLGLGSPCGRLQDEPLVGSSLRPSSGSEPVYRGLCGASALTLRSLPRTASWSVLTSTTTTGTSPTAPSAVGGAKCSCVGTTTAAGEAPPTERRPGSSLPAPPRPTCSGPALPLLPSQV